MDPDHTRPRAEAALSAAREVLRERFGYPDFRRPQRPAIQAVLSGDDALIVLPTGGGKSLCYQVPALMRDGLTVVISPLISLMKDQVDALERRGVAAAFINSSLSAGEVADRLARAQNGSMSLLYLAPERIQSGSMLERLAAIGVSLLAVDEAHCISEWGHDFRPAYRRIGQIRHGLGNPQTVALTATATPDVRDDIARQLQLRTPRVVVGGFDRTNLAYHVISTRTQADKEKGAVAAIANHPGPAIVYTPTRKAVERVTKVLNSRQIVAVAYHAGLDERHRRRAQDAFMGEAARVIVATSAFGMGIDKPDVRLVVHHAMPGSLEAYYQEAGRAGRDGAPSVCVLLHAWADRYTHEYFIEAAHPEVRTVEAVWRTLRNCVDPDGLAAVTATELANRLPPSANAKHTEAALRVLAQGGCLTVEPTAPQRVFVRLLATPARISSELGQARQFDLEVLRALWRAVGSRIQEGAAIDLDGLPPGFGGSAAVVPALERLQSEQFVVWHRTGGGYRLSGEAIVGNRPPLDWGMLTRRRASDLARLDAMQEYARTRACRRAFVLRYFGDPEVRDHCGACDRCLGLHDAPPATPARRARTRTRSR